MREVGWGKVGNHAGLAEGELREGEIKESSGR